MKKSLFVAAIAAISLVACKKLKLLLLKELLILLLLK